MSHEIRTPLNSIIGFSQLLNEEMDSKKREKFISIIRNSGESLIKLISDLIDLSKIEAGDFNLNYSSLSIKELFIEIQDIYSIELLKREKNEIKLHYKLPQDDIFAFSDGYRIKQVLMNLLNNAIKFTEKGEIIFSCEKKEDELLFIVSDTGTGIPDEDQKKIFERFTKFNYQGMNIEGTGIGLSIVEKLIAILKGRIWLKSELGKGTSFYFAVPFIHSKSKTPLTRITIEKKNAVDLANKNVILIVEDDEESYLLIKEILRPMNLEIHIVTNGEDAISFLKINPQIRLILMDIKLPYMSGYETARMIKKINPDIPIIAQTAYAMVGDKERAFEAGCKEYITKPLNPDKLRFLVNEYIFERN
jgi:CheY-like chemotaxis protein